MVNIPGMDYSEESPMKQITLTELVKARSQSEAARLLGVSAPAITKAIKSGRTILVTEQEDGTFEAEELRPFPSTKKTQAA